MPPAKATAKNPVDEGQWEEIDPFTQPIDLEEGEEFTALYMGANELSVPDPNGAEGDTRVSLLHEFQTSKDSEPFGLWGSAVLDKRLAEAPIGSRVRVLYEGKQNLDGGRTARRYRVWIDRSQPF